MRHAVPAVLLAAALFVLAANLRMGIASVGPVLPAVLHDLGMGVVYGSLLTTAPVVMMGVASPLAARLAARHGVERSILFALLLVGAATAVREWTSDPWLLLATAVVLGCGIAIGNTMLPAVVRTYFPLRAAAMTGLYTVGINVGAGIAAFGSPRLAATGTGWHGALAVWALLALVAAAVWALIAARSDVHTRSVAGAMPWRNPTAWMMTLFFGLQSMVYYGILAWLAPLYEDRGWPKDRAGLLLAFFTLVQMGGAMGVSMAVQRTGRLLAGMRATALVAASGLLLVALTPLSSPWLWAIVLGVGVGGIFPLSMTLPLVLTRSAEEARRWTALMLCYGYLMSALGPFLVAALRTATGSFAVAFAVLAALSVTTAAVAGPARGHRVQPAR